jgi:hypothetical protein
VLHKRNPFLALAQITALGWSLAMVLGQLAGNLVPLRQHGRQRQVRFDGNLNLVQREGELAPFATQPGVR